MKRSLLTVASLALLMTAFTSAASAQDRSQPSAKPDTSGTTATKPIIVAGRVSSDGHSLVTDLDSEWAVSNAEALKGKEGSLVKVKCYVDPDHNQIRVLSVKNVQPEIRFDPR